MKATLGLGASKLFFGFKPTDLMDPLVFLILNKVVGTNFAQSKNKLKQIPQLDGGVWVNYWREL